MKKFDYLSNIIENIFLGKTKQEMKNLQVSIPDYKKALLEKLSEKGKVFVLTHAFEDLLEIPPNIGIIASKVYYENDRVVDCRIIDKVEEVLKLRKKFPKDEFLLVSDGQNDDKVAEIFDIVLRVLSNYVREGWVLRNAFSGVLKCDRAQDIAGLEELV